MKPNPLLVVIPTIVYTLAMFVVLSIWDNTLVQTTVLVSAIIISYLITKKIIKDDASTK